MVCKELPVPDNGRVDLPTGESVHMKGDSFIVQFPCQRWVLSNSWLNGGYRRDLMAVFNHQIPVAACDECHANGDVNAYLGRVAVSLSLNPAATSGLITRAEMRNAAIVCGSYRDLTVCAIVTAGIDRNGGRAGDPASYYETDGTFEPLEGTINTFLVIGADLPEYAILKALMTATEAKTAALQQLMARSLYSHGIATGSGTDMIAVITNPGSPFHLSDAGKHAKLGELIANTIIRATTLALERETGLSPEFQRDVQVRLSRFGISMDDIWHSAAHEVCVESPDPETREQFIRHFQSRAKDPRTVARVVAALHVLDEEEWGLLPQEAARDAITRILGNDEGVIPAAVNQSLDLIVTLIAKRAMKEFCTPENTGRLLAGSMPDRVKPEGEHQCRNSME